MFKSINWKFVFTTAAHYSVISATIAFMLAFLAELAEIPIPGAKGIVPFEAGLLLGLGIAGYFVYILVDMLVEMIYSKPQPKDVEPQKATIITYLRKRLQKA